jgi:hypothetical protein
VGSFNFSWLLPFFNTGTSVCIGLAYQGKDIVLSFIILYINSLRAYVRPSDTTVPRFNSPAELTGRTGPAGAEASSPLRLFFFVVCHHRLPSVCDHWTQRKVTGKR